MEHFGYLGVVYLNVFSMQATTSLIYCYIGHRISTKVSQLTYAGYSSLWYHAPVRALRGIRLLMFYGHQEIYFSGYGIIICYMETFQQVTSSMIVINVSVIDGFFFFRFYGKLQLFISFCGNSSILPKCFSIFFSGKVRIIHVHK